MSNKSKRKTKHFYIFNEKRKMFLFNQLDFMVARALGRIGWDVDGVERTPTSTIYSIRTLGYIICIIIRKATNITDNTIDNVMTVSFDIIHPLSIKDILLLSPRKMASSFWKAFDKIILEECRRKQ